MRFTKEQRFLCTRIAILAASAGGIASGYAAVTGFPFWYGGFVLFFWIVFGLLNLPQKSSLRLLWKQPRLFCAFYAALAGVFYLADQFGLAANLWFYPFYSGWEFLWVYLVLYPFGALAILEFLYFLGGCIEEPFRFTELLKTRWHDFLDMSEHILFFIMIAAIVAGATPFGLRIDLRFTTTVVVLWIVVSLVRMRMQVLNSGHYTLIILISAGLAILSGNLPNVIAREWIYIWDPFLNYVLLGVPIFSWVGWFWLALIQLRLWMFLTGITRVTIGHQE